jgi:hypothetical protein
MLNWKIMVGKMGDQFPAACEIVTSGEVQAGRLISLLSTSGVFKDNYPDRSNPLRKSMRYPF